MRTMTALALMLAVGVAGAQPEQPKPKTGSPYAGPMTPGGSPAPKKSALEEALDLALKNNPDLRVAASKLALAEAELSKTRLQVTQKVAAAYADVEVARATVKEAERQAARMGQLRKSGVLSSEEASKSELQLVEAKAKLAAAERELTHLQGKGGKGATNTAVTIRWLELAGLGGVAGNDAGYHPNMRLEIVTAVPAAKTTGSDKLRQALQKPVTLSGHGMLLSDYLALVKKTAGIGIQADTKDAAWKEPVDFDFKDVTVGGMLQFLEDSLPNHRVVVRHYGLLITTREKVPEGAVTLTAFLHAEPTKAAEAKPGTPAGRTPRR